MAQRVACRAVISPIRGFESRSGSFSSFGIFSWQDICVMESHFSNSSRRFFVVNPLFHCEKMAFFGEGKHNELEQLLAESQSLQL